MAVMLLAFFGFTAAAIKGIILSLVLAFVSYSDLKTRECPDFPYLMIAVAAFIGCDLHCLPDMLLAALAVFCFQFFGAWATNAKLNGADAKLATACAFLLGSARGITGLVNTIKNYIGYLKNSFLIEEAKRYDVKGRKYIGTLSKYYFVDPGLRNARLNFRQIEESHLMENIIYNELLRYGYRERTS